MIPNKASLRGMCNILLTGKCVPTLDPQVAVPKTLGEQQLNVLTAELHI